MRVILAPMQGVLDHLMREVLTSVNDYDLCVSEFIRIVDQLLPAKVFYRLCPELLQDGKTRAGTPVRVQLLGQHPEWLAENAVRAIELGSPGVDLNFGCPAPTVNKSKGGAVLLKEPETIYRIVKAVREAVPAHLPVSAKIRLGYDDKDLYLENAQAVFQGAPTSWPSMPAPSAKATRPPPTGSMWMPSAAPCPSPSPPTARFGIIRMPSPAPASPVAMP